MRFNVGEYLTRLSIRKPWYVLAGTQEEIYFLYELYIHFHIWVIALQFKLIDFHVVGIGNLAGIYLFAKLFSVD